MGNGKRKVTILSDHVIIQADTEESPQDVMDTTVWWKRRADAVGSVKKWTYPQLPDGEGNGKMFVDGFELKVKERGKYLAMSL